MLLAAALLVLLALILGGVGFALHALWWIAIIVFIVAVIVWASNRTRGPRL